jgi:HEAT repeat protein
MSSQSTLLFAAATPSAAPADLKPDQSALDSAFAALQTYDCGSSRGALVPIDEAVRSAVGDANAWQQLERRLAAVLGAKVPREAKEYVCRKLELIGAAVSAAPLGELLADKELADTSRRALEAISGPEAVKALRENLPTLSGLQKVGVVNSLGRRGDTASVPALAKLLGDPDTQIASAAAAALGQIGTTEAAAALRQILPTASETFRLALADASLTCAEHLTKRGKVAEARALLQAVELSPQPKYVQLAAQRAIADLSKAREAEE